MMTKPTHRRTPSGYSDGMASTDGSDLGAAAGDDAAVCVHGGGPRPHPRVHPAADGMARLLAAALAPQAARRARRHDPRDLLHRPLPRLRVLLFHHYPRALLDGGLARADADDGRLLRRESLPRQLAQDPLRARAPADGARPRLVRLLVAEPVRRQLGRAAVLRAALLVWRLRHGHRVLGRVSDHDWRAVRDGDRVGA